MSADRSAMAKRSGFDVLGYLLDMAWLEAESASRHTKRGNGR